MRKIMLIACVSKKRPEKLPARYLYDSPLFKKNLEFAHKQKPNAIFILSAFYGLLTLDEEVAPYNKTLITMPVSDIKLWANTVVKQLSACTDLQQDQFIFLAGEKYRKYLIPHMHYYDVPMAGLPIGKQLQYLTQYLAKG